VGGGVLERIASYERHTKNDPMLAELMAVGGWVHQTSIRPHLVQTAHQAAAFRLSGTHIAMAK
jgi:hypothetical protein